MKLIFLVRKPILTERQLERLANIFDNAGQVALGVVVLSPMISGFDRVNIFVVISGIGAVIICWAASIYFERMAE